MRRAPASAKKIPGIADALPTNPHHTCECHTTGNASNASQRGRPNATSAAQIEAGRADRMKIAMKAEVAQPTLMCSLASSHTHMKKNVDGYALMLIS